MGCCELSNLGAGNQTQVLWRQAFLSTESSLPISFAPVVEGTYSESIELLNVTTLILPKEISANPQIALKKHRTLSF